MKFIHNHINGNNKNRIAGEKDILLLFLNVIFFGYKNQNIKLIKKDIHGLVK